MNVNRWAVLAAAAFLMSPDGTAAIDVDVTTADITRAVAVANSAANARARFHAPYILAVSDPMIERLEVITEFRRFVLASEEQTRLGRWMVARGGYDLKGRTLKDMLKRWHGQVSVKARLRFHPHHRYSGVPLFDILIDEPSLLAVETDRTPLTTSAMDREMASVMTGAVIETSFNAPSVDDRVLPVRLLLDAKELVRVSVDFSRLE
jgi:hypothetical protein